MTEHAVQKLRLSSPADLVEAVPYLLGYHPADSLVGLALRGPRRRVVFSMRMDLPEPGDDQGAGCAAEAAAAYLARARGEQAVLVVYDDTPHTADGLTRRELVEQTAEALQQHGIGLLDAVHVAGGQWWSYTCDVSTCCPREGSPIPAAGASAVAATATYAGLVALPNREAVGKVLEPQGFPARQVMARALAHADEDLAARITGPASLAAVREESLGLLAAAADGEQVLSDDEAARLIVGLEDIAVRDACCAWTGTARAGAAQRLWQQLVRRSAPGYDVVPLAMVGWSAWSAGDSTLARIALDRCLAGDPDYSLARLLSRALDSAVDPAGVRDW
ncbi:MAG: DUF4192 domain-containing protein [Mycobacteriales bacterium]